MTTLTVAPNAAVMTSPAPGTTITGRRDDVQVEYGDGSDVVHFERGAVAWRYGLPFGGGVIGGERGGAGECSGGLCDVDDAGGEVGGLADLCVRGESESEYGATLVLSGPQVAKVPTSGQEVQYVYHFSGGDATALTGVKATGVSGVNARIVSVGPGVVVIGLSVTAQVAGAARQASRSQMMTARPRAVQQGYVEFDGAWGAFDESLETFNGPTINSVSPSEITAAQSGTTDLEIDSPDVVTDIDGAWVSAMFSSSDGSYSEESGGGGTGYYMTASFSTPSVAGAYCMQLVGPACVELTDPYGEVGCLRWVEAAGACYPITVDPAVIAAPVITSISFDTSPVVAGTSDGLTIVGSNFGASGFVEACPSDGSNNP